MKKIIVHFKKEEFERVKNAISILANFLKYTLLT